MIKLTDILNESVNEGKGRDLATNLIRNARQSMRKLTDDEVEEFRKEIALAFDLRESIKSLNESSMTISIANIVRELFPDDFFWAYTPQDTEKAKAVISDLVKTLNRFYKQHNIKVRFTDTNYKMKMYSKD